MVASRQKLLGAYYTPADVVRSLVKWVVRRTSDRMLDPSCGDGRFLTIHPNSVGVEGDPDAAAIVHRRTPGSLIHQGDFFSWAGHTCERFECAAGNPPFIRYQRFSGEVRQAALEICGRHGAKFSALSSSWAPFLVATATLLKPGGRMAFVVPAEIGHATYAFPLLQYLVDHFSHVHLLAIREKLFHELSEDCWLLFCDGYGAKAPSVSFKTTNAFAPTDKPPAGGQEICLADLHLWGGRLRQFLLPPSIRNLYRRLAVSPQAVRLADLARVGIGYVTGANDFFHLRPSMAESLQIPPQFLLPAVRNGRDLVGKSIKATTVDEWTFRDEPHFLLRIRESDEVPTSIRRYLETTGGQLARETYKCRNRDPWYVVPDVQVPDGFLSYMSGETPSLVANEAKCVATNSVHVVQMRDGLSFANVQRYWGDPLTALSCEVEGHPLGGGMLKLEPREAGRVLVRRGKPSPKEESEMLREGVQLMRRWRHYG